MYHLIKSIVCFFVIFCLLGSQTAIAETIYYYHNDPVGTPLAMTDENGAKVWEADYKPFGEVNSEEVFPAASTFANDRKFVGKERDEESGLDYFGARFLYAQVGRFLAVEPVRAVDQFSGRTNYTLLAEPQRQNAYAYSLNNPYRYVDPDGRAPLFTHGITLRGPIAGAGGGLRGVSFKAVPRGQLALPGGSGVKVAPKVTNSVGKPTTKIIQENPRNLIPTQTKSEMSGSQVKRLTKSIKKNGFDQNQPVDASRNPNTGRLEIQDGHHRTVAAKNAGVNKIPVRVRE